MTEDLIFHEDHYRKVRQERNRRGLPDFSDLYPENGRIFGHILEGKKLFNKEKQKEYTIQSVHKHWYRGWYYMILTYSLSETTSELLTDEIIDGKRYGHSHAPLMWENISCIDNTIINCINDCRTKYEFIN